MPISSSAPLYLFKWKNGISGNNCHRSEQLTKAYKRVLKNIVMIIIENAKQMLTGWKIAVRFKKLPILPTNEFDSCILFPKVELIDEYLPH